MPHSMELDAKQFGPPLGMVSAEGDRRVVDGLRLGRWRDRPRPMADGRGNRDGPATLAGTGRPASAHLHLLVMTLDFRL